MPQQSPRILLVEDDPSLREAVSSALRSEGYELLALEDGTELRGSVVSFRPDLAVLDVRLPKGPSGLSLARMLRETSDIPIIFMTAASDEEDRLSGFDAGADDYIVKPFSLLELLARIKALLRRSGRLTSEAWQVADVVVDEGARTVTRGGHDLDLTRTEFDLLVALANRPGRVLSKTQLLTAIWGMDAQHDPNLVEVHVSSLRRKMDAHGPRLIHTVRGVGYALRPE